MKIIQEQDVEIDIKDVINHNEDEVIEIFPSVMRAHQSSATHDIIGVWEASKQYLKDVIPYSATSLVSISGIFACNLMMARLGEQALAASSLILPVQTVITATSIGSLFAIGIQIGNAMGAGNNYQVGTIFHRSLRIVVGVSLYGAILSSTAIFYLPLMGQESALVDIANPFFHAYASALPALNLFIAETQVALATGHSRLVLMAYIINASLLIGLAYPLIFGINNLPLGFGTIPSLGFLGYGIAFSSSYWITSLGFAIYLKFSSSFAEFNLFTCSRYQERLIGITRQLLRDGLPIACQLGLEELSLLSTTLLIGTIGNNELLALQIVNQYLLPFFSRIFTFGQAAGVMVSNFRGQQRYLSVRRIGNMSITYGTAFCLLGATALSLAYKPLTSLFVAADSENITTIYSLVKTTFIFQGSALALDAVRMTSSGALRGYADTRFSMFATLISTLLMVVLGILLRYFLSTDRIDGIYGTRILAIGLSATALLHRWLTLSNHIITNNPCLEHDKRRLRNNPSPSCFHFSNCFSFFRSNSTRRNLESEESNNRFLSENMPLIIENQQIYSEPAADAPISPSLIEGYCQFDQNCLKMF